MRLAFRGARTIKQDGEAYQKKASPPGNSAALLCAAIASDHQFWPGGAWPDGFSFTVTVGTPLASPLGVFPPPLVCALTGVIDGAIRSSNFWMRKRLFFACMVLLLL